MQYKESKINNSWIEYTLTNKHGMSVQFLNYGGIITKLMVPDKKGVMENIVLSYHDYQDYLDNPYYFGAIIGRVAGRIKNASFQLQNKHCQLNANEGNHLLHGGNAGFHQVIWYGTPFQTKDQVGVKLCYLSLDGDAGFPGTVNVAVTYTLTSSNDFIITYEAIADKQTVLTLTNHTYFNLTGKLKDTIHNHLLQMNAKHYLELDEALIPTGKINEATGTSFDFQHGKKFGEGFNNAHPQNHIVHQGYDHYFFLNQNPVFVKEEISGRTLTMRTNQPGMVLYTANGLNETCQLREGISKKHLGFCLETQASPASLTDNRLPSILLPKNEKYHKQTTFTFHCEK